MKILISGASQGLGEALVLEILRRFPEAKTVGFSRSQENIDVLRQRIQQQFPDRVDDVHLIQGDVGSRDSIDRVVELALNWLGEIDVLINNVGLFRFDEDLSPIPYQEWDISDAQFAEKYGSDPDFEKKQSYLQMVRTNFVGNRDLLDAVWTHSGMNRSRFSVVDIGSVGVVADLINKPMPGTTYYGNAKRRLVDHTLALAAAESVVRVVVIHPGPFGKSAQVIADKFGDTWSVDVGHIARHTFDLFAHLESDRIVQGVIASARHFSLESDYFGDIDSSGQVGLTAARTVKVPEAESHYLVRGSAL